MNLASDGNFAETIKCVFIYQDEEQVEEERLLGVELSALLNAKQVWIEKFDRNLKIENTVWTYLDYKITLQVYLR